MVRALRSVRLLLAAGLLLALAPAAARATDGAADGKAVVVTIDNFTFSPPQLTVPVGTTVTFQNHDDIPHSVVTKDGTFHSKALDTGDSMTFTFAKPGDFAYFCGLHPHMQGMVTVTP